MHSEVMIQDMKFCLDFMFHLMSELEPDLFLFVITTSTFQFF